MYHRNYTTYLQKELDFLKLLVSRFHEQEKVNGLELDVALQKTQEVYGQLLRIKLAPSPEDVFVPIEVPAVKKFVVEQETKIANERPVPVDPAQPEPDPRTQNDPRTSKPVAKLHPNAGTINEINPDPVRSGILADKLSPSDFHPINETLAQHKTGSDLSSKLQTVPLVSISSGIGLNDKFLYIRELFRNDNVLYNNTIKYLDTAESLEIALYFVNQNFDWDKNNETAQKFIHLIHRRHEK